MSDDTAKARRGKRFRRVMICAVALGAVLGLGLLGLGRFVQGERFRSQAEAVIAESTGLDATLGPIRFRLLPRPRVVVHDVSLALEGTTVTVGRIQLVTGLAQAVRGRLDIHALAVDDIDVRFPVPRSELPAYLSALARSLPAPAPGATARGWQLRGGTAGPLTVHGADGPLLMAEASVQPGRDGRLEIQATAALDLAGADARAVAALALDTVSGSVSGTLQFANIDATELDWVATLVPGLLLDGQTVLGGSFAEGLHGTLEGTSHSAAVPAFDGAFAGQAWWHEGRFILNDVDWRCEAGHALADATYTPGEGWGVVIQEAAGGEALAYRLLAFLGEGAYALVPDAGAELAGQGLYISAPNDDATALVRGEATASGFALHQEGRPVFTSLQARAEIAEGVVAFPEILHDHGQLAGTLWIDYEARALAARGNGTLGLDTAWMNALWPGLPVVSASGTATLEEAGIHWSADGGFAFDDWVITPEDADLEVLPDGWQTPARITGGRGTLRIAGDRLDLSPFEAEGIRIEGHVDLGVDDAFPFLLAGELDLASGLAALVMPAYLRETGGELAFADASGVYRPGTGLDPAFRAEGTIRNGRAGLVLGPETVRLSNLRGDLVAGEDHLRFDVTLDTDQAGAVGFDGTYRAASGLLEGRLSASAAALAMVYAEGAAPWLAALPDGAAQAIDLRLSQDNGVRRLDLSLPGPAPVTGDIAMRDDGSGWRVATFDLSTRTSAAALLALGGTGLEGSGNGLLTARLHGDGSFRLHADLGETRIAAGTLLTKAAGVPLSLEALGHWRQDGPDIDGFTVRLLGQSLAARFEDGAFVVPDFELDLAALAPLLPDDATASGRLGGTLNSGLPSADLRLTEVALTLGPEVSLTNLDGTLAYRQGFWVCDGLDVRGLGNDFRVEARLDGNAWSGSARGRLLDLNGLLALRDAYRALVGEAEDTGNVHGLFELDLGEVTYHRGKVQEVQTTVHLSGDSVRLDPFACRAHGGTAAGTLSWSAGGRTSVDLAVDGVDLAVLDELLFEEPRNLSGAMTGTVSVGFVADAEPHPLATVSGSVRYRAVNGTYGKLGNATRLLALLKTTEVIRLHLPTLRDDGLTFQSTSGHFEMTGGVARVEEFLLRDRAYGMQAGGVVNFAEDTTDLEMHVHLLEAVSGIVGSVPILRSTVERFRETTGLRVRVGGSPFDPRFEADPAMRPIRTIGGILTAPFRGGGNNKPEPGE